MIRKYVNQTEQSDKALAGFIRVPLNRYCLRQVIINYPKPFLQVFKSVHT